MIKLDIKNPHTYENSSFENQWLTSNKLLTLIFFNLGVWDTVMNQIYII